MSQTARIGYSTNVHRGRTLDDALTEIERVAPRVRARLIEFGSLGTGEPLELGLWLSALAAERLRRDDGAIESLWHRFTALGLSVRSLNGFPYGHFHAAQVKHAVYRPSWADAARLIYTVDLAEILAGFARLSGARDASISTLPIGWRPDIQSSANGAALGVASTHLEQLVRHLAQLEQRTGVCVHVDLEPEPGCFLDTTLDAIAFFEHTLRSRAGDPDPRRYLRICHDVCHAAVMWESQEEVIARYRHAGVRIGRIQLSSALEARGAEERRRLEAFVEERYLHQTTLRGDDGRLRFFEDLSLALPTFAAIDDPATAVRTHFHVPLACERVDGVGTTRREVEAFLRAWPIDEPWPAIEVETYTWSVLPPSLRTDDLADGIAEELHWAHEALDRARANTAGTPEAGGDVRGAGTTRGSASLPGPGDGRTA